MSAAAAILMVGSMSIGSAAFYAIEQGHVWPLGIQVFLCAAWLAYWADRERKASYQESQP